MARYQTMMAGQVYHFHDLREVMAKASPLRSGDVLAGLAARSAMERMAARFVLADLPLTTFLTEALIPYESDEVTRLIMDSHDRVAFAPIAHLTVGGLRDWLLGTQATTERLTAVSAGLTPEMVAAVSKLMRNQDLIAVAAKCSVVTRFRNTIGLENTLATRLQPNHPTDDLRGILASTLDGLLYGAGDAVIGINPASDSMPILGQLSHLLDSLINEHAIPTQSCILTHVTNTIQLIEQGVPVDLVFQSIGGTETTNRSFGISLATLDEAYAAAQSLQRGAICADGSRGQNVMYFETGQGSALSANGHHGVDQQTCEVRAYAVARRYQPFLVNTVVGFIGPEYLYDGKQIIRAGLEDHCCGKLLGLPMGCDICYTNHAEADQDDMDNLIVLLATSGLSFMMGIPGADDIMLNYQSTSFHDQLFVRETLGKGRAPEFEKWLQQMGMTDDAGRMRAQPVSGLMRGIEQVNEMAGLRHVG